jgi:hypothetical protein
MIHLIFRTSYPLQGKTEGVFSSDRLTSLVEAKESPIRDWSWMNLVGNRASAPQPACAGRLRQ